MLAVQCSTFGCYGALSIGVSLKYKNNYKFTMVTKRYEREKVVTKEMVFGL